MTPLHLMILIHHNGVVSPYAMGNPEHANSTAVAEYTEHLAMTGLIEPWPNNPYPNPWRTTPAGKQHVKDLCNLSVRS